jgi:hypothetical protein
MTEATSSALYQRHQDLQQRQRLLEAEAVELDGRRGQAVLEGDEALAKLHARVAEIEREKGDLTAGLARLDGLLDAARERERQEAERELRVTVVDLCRQRLEVAGSLDRLLQALEAHVLHWRGLGDTLHPLSHRLGLSDGIGMGTGDVADGVTLADALWAVAPSAAALLLGARPAVARPLAAGDGALRLGLRVQQDPPRRAA